MTEFIVSYDDKSSAVAAKKVVWAFLVYIIIALAQEIYSISYSARYPTSLLVHMGLFFPGIFYAFPFFVVILMVVAITSKQQRLNIDGEQLTLKNKAGSILITKSIIKYMSILEVDIMAYPLFSLLLTDRWGRRQNLKSWALIIETIDKKKYNLELKEQDITVILDQLEVAGYPVVLKPADDPINDESYLGLVSYIGKLLVIPTCLYIIFWLIVKFFYR